MAKWRIQKQVLDGAEGEAWSHGRCHSLYLVVNYTVAVWFLIHFTAPPPAPEKTAVREERECCAWCLIYSPRSRAWTWESAALRQSATILGMLKGQLTLGDTRWHEDTMPPPWSNLIGFCPTGELLGVIVWAEAHSMIVTWWRDDVWHHGAIKLNNYHLTATATKYWIGLIIRIKIIFFDLTFWQALMATMASPIFVLCIIKWNIYWAQMYDMSVSYLLIHLE